MRDPGLAPGGKKNLHPPKQLLSGISACSTRSISGWEDPTAKSGILSGHLNSTVVGYCWVTVGYCNIVGWKETPSCGVIMHTTVQLITTPTPSITLIIAITS